MKLVLDGRRLVARDSLKLSEQLGHAALHAQLLAEGYHLAPVRTSRGLRNGLMTFRFIWIRTDSHGRRTIRLVDTSDLGAAG